MTDINGTVTGIQGTPISTNTPQEGDVLIYDGYTWIPSSRGFVTFTSNDTWTCPSGITVVYLSGCGGGAGGGGGCGNTAVGMGGSGGGGALKVNSVVPVVPGTVYTIIIGSGGGGGPGGKVGTVNNGASGTETTFGTLYKANGGGKGWCDDTTSAGYTIGGRNVIGPALVVSNTIPAGTEPYGSPQGVGCGGWGCTVGQLPAEGYPQDNYLGGTPGSSTNGGAGGGGGAGMNGNGGNGGSGSSSTPTNGSNAVANSGAGGGGGGGSTSNINGGNGGNGGSGFLIVAW